MPSPTCPGEASVDETPRADKSQPAGARGDQAKTSRPRIAGQERQRKSHRKSRLGCTNCKLRSVKCDEGKPACQRCAKSGFTCSYSKAEPERGLQHTYAGFIQIDLGGQLPAPDPRKSIPTVQPIRGQVGEYILRPQDFALLQRFSNRTIGTIGTPSLDPIISSFAYGMGFKHPFLTHIFLAIANLHDYYLNPGRHTALDRSALAYHWYHGTVLYQQRLVSQNLSRAERDSIWTACTLLSAASHAHIEELNPLKAWPLLDRGPGNADWLKMAMGKSVVWAIADPLNEESIFKDLRVDMQRLPHPDPMGPVDPDLLPEGMYDLLQLSPTSTPLTNSYHWAARILGRMIPIEHSQKNCIAMLLFATGMEPKFHKLLLERDHRALIMFLWWLAIASEFQCWWILRRCWVEGWATIIYLKQNCEDDRVILDLLKWPASALRKMQPVHKEHEQLYYSWDSWSTDEVAKKEATA